MRVPILGVPIDAVTSDQAMAQIAVAVKYGRRPFFVVTPNPEFLVMAKRDAYFREILQTADLAIPDGRGLLWAARLRGEPLPERVTGTDMVIRVCAWAAKRRRTVHFLGGADGAAEQAASRLRRHYPKLEITADHGGQLHQDEHGSWHLPETSWQRLQELQPEILFVAFGHGKQEKWISQHLMKMPWLKVAIGVGGAFDFISGQVSRAPDRLQRLGLEWLYRLAKEPRRWRRILNAVVVFPYMVLRSDD